MWLALMKVAIAQGNWQRVKQMFHDYQISASTVQEDNKRPLLTLAIEYGQLALLDRFLALERLMIPKIRVFLFIYKDENGNTILMMAVELADQTTISMVFQACKELISIPNQEGKTPLLYASQLGLEHCVCEFLANGSSISETDIHGNNALHL
jgi:ankyrin repeat protein